MSAEVPPPLLLLLHEGGWDEVAMVAVGLLVAYAVIMWTGRRSRDEDEEDDDAESPESDESTMTRGDPPIPRP